MTRRIVPCNVGTGILRKGATASSRDRVNANEQIDSEIFKSNSLVYFERCPYPRYILINKFCCEYSRHPFYEVFLFMTFACLCNGVRRVMYSAYWHYFYYERITV